MRTAPASAVPIDAPRFVAVFCRPPTSLLCSSGTDDTVTRRAATPARPRRGRPAAWASHDLWPGALIERRHQDQDAGEQREQPTWTRAGRRVRAHLGDARGGQQQGDGQRQQPNAGATADSPRATERNSGTAKNRPACSRYWKKNAVRPARKRRFSRIAGSTSGSPPRASRRSSHARRPRSTPPARTSQIAADRPSHSGAASFGRTNPHSPGGGCRTRSCRARGPTTRCPPGRASRASGSASAIGGTGRGWRSRRGPHRRRPSATRGRW